MNAEEFQQAVAAIAAQRDEIAKRLQELQRTVDHERAITLKIAERAERLFRELEEIRAQLGGAK